MSDLERMLPGTELDRLVAVEVMGWKLFDYEASEFVDPETTDYSSDGFAWDGREGDDEAWAWQPSRDGNDSLEVIARVVGLAHVRFAIHGVSAGKGDAPTWAVEIYANGTRYIGAGASMPEAVCKAAILFVRREND